MNVKWNIEFFVKIGLIPVNWYYFYHIYGYSLGLYVEKQQSKNKQKQIKVFEKMKRKGVEIYNKNILCI